MTTQAPNIRLDIELSGALASRLIAEADRRSLRPIDVMADVIETVIKDDLFAAVLDT